MTSTYNGASIAWAMMQVGGQGNRELVKNPDLTPRKKMP
jgi:hypothetical protein